MYYLSILRVFIVWVHTEKVHLKKREVFVFNFEEIRNRIFKRAKHDTRDSVERGELREQIVFSVLQEMKNKKEILDFVRTPKYGQADLIDGIDFYIVAMKRERVVVPIQVTGQYFVEEHKRKHPLIPIVVVPDEEERREEITRSQIEQIIQTF